MSTWPADRSYMRAYAAARWRRRRRVALLFLHQLRGPGCAGCHRDAENYVIDHVDQGAKTEDPTRFLTWALPRLWRELRGCQALCPECNARKCAAEGGPQRTLARQPHFFRRARGEEAPF